MLVWHFELEGLQARSGGMGVEMGDLALTGAQKPFFIASGASRQMRGLILPFRAPAPCAGRDGCWALKLPPTDVARG